MSYWALILEPKIQHYNNKVTLLNSVLSLCPNYIVSFRCYGKEIRVLQW